MSSPLPKKRALTSQISASASKLALAGFAAAMLFDNSLVAQESRFTFSLGGGFTQPRSNAGRRLDAGWNIHGAGGVNFNKFVGATLDLNYNRFGINSTTLSNIGFPGGNVGIFSATVNPVVHLTPGRHADVYLTGGGGMYRIQQEFTQPSSATFPAFDPFFGFYNVTVPTTEILASSSVIKPGMNFGVGFAVGTRWRAKVFAEARYHRIFRGNERYVDYIPVTFGLRW